MTHDRTLRQTAAVFADLPGERFVRSDHAPLTYAAGADPQADPLAPGLGFKVWRAGEADAGPPAGLFADLPGLGFKFTHASEAELRAAATGACPRCRGRTTQVYARHGLRATQCEVCKGVYLETK